MDIAHISNVFEPVHRCQILVFTKMINKMQLCWIIYCSLSALHVSSYIFAHHQEHLNCNYSFWFYSRHSWIKPEAVITVKMRLMMSENTARTLNTTSCVQSAIPLHFYDICNTQRGCLTSKFALNNYTSTVTKSTNAHKCTKYLINTVFLLHVSATLVAIFSEAYYQRWKLQDLF